jgi:hypothetical protein
MEASPCTHMNFNEKYGPAYFNVCQCVTKNSSSLLLGCYPDVVDLFYFSYSSNFFGNSIYAYCIHKTFRSCDDRNRYWCAYVHVTVDSDMRTTTGGYIYIHQKGPIKLVTVSDSPKG